MHSLYVRTKTHVWMSAHCPPGTDRHTLRHSRNGRCLGTSRGQTNILNHNKKCSRSFYEFHLAKPTVTTLLFQVILPSKKNINREPNANTEFHKQFKYYYLCYNFFQYQVKTDKHVTHRKCIVICTCQSKSACIYVHICFLIFRHENISIRTMNITVFNSA